MLLATAARLGARSDFHDGSAGLEALPSAPPGFAVTVFAREPMVRQPCSMAFDARGRLFVGMGPQYRNPTPLRCEEGGKNPELVARGFRNPWDLGFDDGFNWLGTDND